MPNMIIMPTYNERENLEQVAGQILALKQEFWLTIVDDASPDGTGELADELGRRWERVRVIHRPGRLGLGSAYVTGFKYALAQGVEHVFQMDADLSHDPARLPSLLRALEDHDVVVGSRYVPGGGTVNWGILRQVISRGGSLYARTILGMPIRDCTGGFNGYRRKVLESIGLDTILSNGYSFQIELKYRCYQRGFRMVEVPITFVDRRAGRSKMSVRIFLEAMMRVWQLRLGVGCRHA
jgi:dolichol-phosphate mannosyltransferase